MENRKTTRAKKLLVHYFRLVMEAATVKFDSDNISEIEEIVDAIIEAADNEAADRMDTHLTRSH